MLPLAFRGSMEGWACKQARPQTPVPPKAKETLHPSLPLSATSQISGHPSPCHKTMWCLHRACINLLWASSHLREYILQLIHPKHHLAVTMLHGEPQPGRLHSLSTDAWSNTFQLQLLATQTWHLQTQRSRVSQTLVPLKTSLEML